ncbi:hypothetical protein JY651_41435 [Pyxidicoccus parkwayensis]|uniref:Uncharacterized protein n=1 Tax=Pyxidicoccus parkwayensis TaxID=2813578 RepID=A0ABX7NW03_9BACT|nr:hypothetical protein [Pyxidicoccus parkwaysis]QSQ21574.1 hypothetical protein JY651_41435 [Pyxidicoccus parkwaysis]
MADNDKLAGTLKAARADRKGVQLKLERPVGTLNTVAMRLVVSGKMAGQARRQFHNAVFTGPETITLPDDFLPTAGEGWVQATFSVADVTGAGAKFVEKGTLVLSNGQQEQLWDDFNLPAGAQADFINLVWTVTE